MSAQITPHVCQFCETPLRDHWWDPCTYTPTVAPTSPVTASEPVKLGQDVIAHVVAELRRVLDGDQ